MTFSLSRRAVLRTAAVTTAITVPPAVGPVLTATASRTGARATVVLVHGAWADASSWNGVVEHLQHRGLTVYAVANPLRGVATDAAYLTAFLKTVAGPVVLVGHSYGGFVVTNAAVGIPAVKALVYVDAYIPDRGDTVLTLTGKFPGSRVSPAVLDFVPSAGGVVDTYIKRAVFPGVFANDLPASRGAVLAATQRPLALTALSEPSGTPAWRSRPSWALVGTVDRVIPPAAQEYMARRARSHLTAVHASHLSPVSRPHRVTQVVLDAIHHSC